MVEDVFGIIDTTLAGTFHIEEVIAEGGFGVVYRAEHVAFRAPVALKCLKIPGTVTEAQAVAFVENFREEAEILFHLSAQIPEVVRPLHADAMTLSDGTFVPYIAMEWIDGRPLDSIVIVREEDGLKPLSVRKVIKLLTPIAHALHRAHHFRVPGGAVVSVTHCDLKPENIVVTEPDNPVRAKILDFGIAKAREAVRQNVGKITESEAPKPFTPSYGAPEQWVPKRYGQSGPWTDVWGMALTMVECLTGQPPIDGDMHAMMGTALDPGRRPTPRSEGASVTDDVERVFKRALAVDPRDRYQDVETFWTDLERSHGVPSSFARAAKRRGRRTYDEDTADAARPSDPSSPFGGFHELELDGGPAAPAGFEAGGAIGSEIELALDAGPGDELLSAEEYDPDVDRLAGRVPSAPPLSSTGRFDLDLGPASDSVPPPPVSRSHHPAAVSGTWPNAALGRSGRFPAPGDAAHGSLPPVDSAPPAAGGWRHSLRAPFILVGLGLLLTVLDMSLAKSFGGTLAFGPVRVRWLAIGIVAIGTALAFWTLASGREGE